MLEAAGQGADLLGHGVLELLLQARRRHLVHESPHQLRVLLLRRVSHDAEHHAAVDGHRDVVRCLAALDRDVEDAVGFGHEVADARKETRAHEARGPHRRAAVRLNLCSARRNKRIVALRDDQVWRPSSPGDGNETTWPEGGRPGMDGNVKQSP